MTQPCPPQELLIFINELLDTIIYNKNTVLPNNFKNYL